MSELRSYKKVRSVGGVHRDLYERALVLADELEDRRPEDSQGNYVYGVPGAYLEVRHKARQDQIPGALHAKHGGKGVPTTIITARYRGTKANLLAVAQVPGLPASRPAGTVNGYAGTELGGHYWLSREESGLVRIRLGSPTVTARTEEEPLIGETAIDKSTRLRELATEDSERLYLVAQGIMANMAAVEMLAEGEPMRVAMEERSRQLP